ncbi:unnamed protein product [Prorocentrum cordatum]|uniref:Reverse transcriptase domain-containing protein n=1 Tax=Prorocentrum cordatum TaxID=2364126 RepID=A0ABN9TD74_9DINO|nr:unnamed protein product [Polarella glacialis]
MVNATRFLGESVLWDLHVEGDKPEQEDQWDATFQMALQMLDRLGSSMRLAVFEENAALHDVGRGLNRARYAATYARLRGRFALATAANGLQVFGLNDNGWDQGAVFLAPDRAWLSPFGHADRMVAAASLPLLLDAQPEPSGTSLPRNLDVVAPALRGLGGGGPQGRQLRRRPRARAARPAARGARLRLSGYGAAASTTWARRRGGQPAVRHGEGLAHADQGRRQLDVPAHVADDREVGRVSPLPPATGCSARRGLGLSLCLRSGNTNDLYVGEVSAGPCRDGCLIAFSLRHFLPSELRVSHSWLDGRLQGIRLRRAGPRERDVYILNGYAPLNEVSHAVTGTDHHEKVAAHREFQNKYWNQCRAALQQIPRRTALVVTMDANAAMSPNPPHVGFAGQRRMYAATNYNGMRLLDLLQTFHMTALNTFGRMNRQNGTWKHTTGPGWTTIDYICTRLHGSYGKRAAPLKKLPVSLSGYRDHRPVQAQIYVGLRARRRPEEKPARWDRDALVQDLNLLRDPDAELPQRLVDMRSKFVTLLDQRLLSGQWPDECGDERRYATPSDYFNALEHTLIEVAAPYYILQPQKLTRPKLKDSTLALIDRKHRIQRRMASMTNQESDSYAAMQAEFDTAYREAARAVRAERRQRLADTATEAETADANQNLRKLHSVIRRLAPKPAAPTVTVNNPESGGLCMDDAEEADVRVRALCSIFEGSMIDMLIDTETDLPDQDTHDGSIIELWKLLATEATPALHGVFNACQALGHSVQRFKDGETVSLRKPKGDGKNAKDHYRTINLINHIGKVFMNVTVMPSLRGLASRFSSSQFGALAGRSTRDALAVVAEVVRRYRLHGRTSRLGKTAIPGVLLAVLIDLEKAFDLVDRDEIWNALERLSLRRNVRWSVEELHEGTCYIARDIRTNRPIKKLLISRGVRQGSVEGPLLFIAVYDLLTANLEQSHAMSEFTVVSVVFDPTLEKTRHLHLPPGNDGEECLPVSPIKFVDDLIAFTIVEDFETISRFLSFLKNEITKGKMKKQQDPQENGAQENPDEAPEELLAQENPDEAPEDPKYDPTKLVRAVVFGRFNFEGPKHKEINSLLGVLLDDLIHLWRTFTPEAQQQARDTHGLNEELPNPSRPWLRWLCCVPRARLKGVRSTTTDDEEKIAAGIAPPPDALLPCPICSRMCQGPKGLDNHMFSVHKKYANPTDLTDDQLRSLKCPRCATKFSRKDTLPLRVGHLSHPLLDLPSLHHPTMFVPIAEVQGGVKRQEPEAQDSTTASSESTPNGKLTNLMCRLLLQHEAAHQADARDDNFTLTLKVGTKIEMALENGLQNYIATGKSAREGDNFKGHPLGKKPDALLRSVIFRMAEAYENSSQPVQEAVKNGTNPEKALGALEVLQRWGSIAKDTEIMARATRCFKVKLAEGDVEQVRWIWAVNYHPELKLALSTLRDKGGLKAAGILLGHDYGQRSKSISAGCGMTNMLCNRFQGWSVFVPGKLLVL